MAQEKDLNLWKPGSEQRKRSQGQGDTLLAHALSESPPLKPHLLTESQLYFPHDPVTSKCTRHLVGTLDQTFVL